MNERIRLLAEQAKNSIPKDKFGVSEWIEEYNQTLAKLIVLECVKIVDEERPGYLGCGYITKTKGMLVKEHFGVE